MARRAAAILLSLALLPLSPSFPLSAVSRQTTVTSCDDWVSVYNNYWSKFPQCHRGLSTTQCCELYDLMDKSIRIFETSLGCVVTNLQVFAERYAAHCKGGSAMEDTGSIPPGPGQPVPGDNIQGGHGDEDGIIILPDGTTQIQGSTPSGSADSGSGSGSGSSPPAATTSPPTVTDTGATTYSGSSGGTEGGHGCGSTGCQTRPTGYCSCCSKCCSYNAARAVHELKPRFLFPAALTLRSGSCINCSNPGDCACDASRCGECNACQNTQPPPPPPPQPQCHQCCSTCCRTGRSTVQLLTETETLPVSAANVESRCGCGGSGGIQCSIHCTGCARPNTCDICQQGCTHCPVECHSQYQCSSTSGGTCPACPPSGGSGASTNAGGEQQQAPRDDDGSVCFGAEAMVQVAGGKRKRMDEVKVGDMVHVGHGVYSEVFLFTHRSDVHVARFVNLHTKKGTLSATEGHFVHSTRGVVPAETLQVGDLIPTDQGEWERVVEISSERKTGLYNPQTLHGDIVVDGFIATTYTSILSQTTAQSLLAPLRAMYRILGQGCGEQMGAMLFRARS